MLTNTLETKTATTSILALFSEQPNVSPSACAAVGVRDCVACILSMCSRSNVHTSHTRLHGACTNLFIHSILYTSLSLQPLLCTRRPGVCALGLAHTHMHTFTHTHLERHLAGTNGEYKSKSSELAPSVHFVRWFGRSRPLRLPCGRMGVRPSVPCVCNCSVLIQPYVVAYSADGREICHIYFSNTHRPIIVRSVRLSVGVRINDDECANARTSVARLL